ncbi:hypothetical protein [Vibrio chagasii]|uniref:hypothetical protein n=1 Tax=Vibrio chagasii TaxID=170679 RepID=UPI0022848A62|nr:hypothetical protein [Vibrio chagasii]MCY9828821.1 hypothetical protein [Vibrio chagasii]
MAHLAAQGGEAIYLLTLSLRSIVGLILPQQASLLLSNSTLRMEQNECRYLPIVSHSLFKMAWSYSPSTLTLDECDPTGEEPSRHGRYDWVFNAY